MPKFHLRASPDRMSLFIEEVEGLGYDSMDDLDALIETMGIQSEVDYDLIEQVLDAGSCPDPEKIAEGFPPVDGDDGYLKFKVDVSPEPRFLPDEEEGASIDYKNAMKYSTVAKGDELAEYVAATFGVPGRDVFGKPIPSEPGQEQSYSLGSGVEQNGQKIFALKEGLPRCVNYQISVENVLNITKNVDLRVGNIKSPSSVSIYGEVKDGFEIISGGDIRIYGLCGAVKIEAKGNVMLYGGMNGKAKASVKSGGRVEAKFLTGCQVEAKDAVMVTRNIMHSRVYSLYKICAKGNILGGQMMALQGVTARFLGSDAGVRTTVLIHQHFEGEKLLEFGDRLLEKAKQYFLKYRTCFEKEQIPAAMVTELQADLLELEKLYQMKKKVEEQLEILRAEISRGGVGSVKVTGGVFGDVVLKAPYCFKEFVEPMMGKRIFIPLISQRKFDVQ